MCLKKDKTRCLWVPQRVQEGDLRLRKERRDKSVSDAPTKLLDAKRMMKLLTSTVYEFKEGRIASAPT